MLRDPEKRKMYDQVRQHDTCPQECPPEGVHPRAPQVGFRSPGPPMLRAYPLTACGCLGSSAVASAPLVAALNQSNEFRSCFWPH